MGFSPVIYDEDDSNNGLIPDGSDIGDFVFDNDENQTR